MQSQEQCSKLGIQEGGVSQKGPGTALDGRVKPSSWTRNAADGGMRLKYLFANSPRWAKKVKKRAEGRRQHRVWARFSGCSMLIGIWLMPVRIEE